MDALSEFVQEAQGLSEHFEPQVVFNIGPWGVTQYIIWLFIAFVVVLAVVLIAAKKLTLVPNNKFINMVEFGYQFVRRNVAEDVIGHGYKAHLPFLATLFFFILICNILGLVPGFKTSTGSISCTWALAVVSFVYFNYYGLKTSGLLGYLKSLCPSGVPGPMRPIIWFLEFFSMVIRVLTLAVRLYGNMLAGHMVLAVFGIATTCFIQAALFAGTMDLIAGLPSIAWFLLLVIMYAMECLVAFIQAFVFAILSASYINMAIHAH
ncbi:MAG: F0F1 ATP synthase subunit A [Eggerthellaceae bacterium]|nr:F0F1 ATP synthase subunit A [Eggerthellaceae bacterium]